MKDSLEAAQKNVHGLTAERDKLLSASKQVEEYELKLKNLERLKKDLEEELQLSKEMNKQHMLSIESLTKELSDVKMHYKEEQKLRKTYYNMIEDMKGSIRVFARARPLTEDEKQSGHKMSVTFGDDDMSITVADKRNVSKTFLYDRVFPPSASQEEVFKDTSVSV